MLPEPIRVTLLVLEALEKLGIPYLIGGSLASSVHGIARATRDVDLVADIKPEQAESLAQLLGDAFYADAAMIRRAAQSKRSFNLIHYDTAFKVDVFVLAHTPFSQVQFARRRKEVIFIEPERTAYVSTPEDIILSKLDWFRMGGEVSERQWRDVLNVVKVQGQALDREYLEKWARELNLSGLLARALNETGVNGIEGR